MIDDWFGPSAADPGEAAKPFAKPALPKRFYKAVDHAPGEGGFVVRLDGRPVRTPAKALLAVPSERVAEALAAEWAAQKDVIDPATMPLTRLVNSAIDGVAREADAVRAEIVRYAGTDLLCYRAESPERLVERQSEQWQPLVGWMRDAFGARFMLAEGVIHVAQAEEALAAVDRAIGPVDPLRLAALSTVTTLTGSAILALAVLHGRLSAEEAWALAHLDEDYQMELWGEDEEALARRASRWRDMHAAALVLAEG